MNRRAELLPESLLWADGHLSDEALCAYADGHTSLLPASALMHAEHCDGCSTRLGSLALASWALEGAMREAASAALEGALGGAAPAALEGVLGGAALGGALGGAAPAALEGALGGAAPAALEGAASPSSAPASAASFRPPPWAAVAAALALAAFTSLPSLGLVVQWGRTAWAVWPRVVPQLPALGHTLRALVARALGPLGGALPLFASLILLVSGWVVASAALKLRSQLYGQEGEEALPIRSQKGTILSCAAPPPARSSASASPPPSSPRPPRRSPPCGARASGRKPKRRSRSI